jgi:hypothetical protein
MIDDYGEVFAAFKGRGRALPASNWCLFQSFSSGSISGFLSFWRHHNRRCNKLDSCCLILEDTGPIRLGMMMDNYGEVFAALKGRGHALLATSNWSV